MKTKKAVAGRRSARYDERHNKAYPQAGSESSLKLFVGEVLLFGDKQRQDFWIFFEALLIQFYQESPHNPPKARLTRRGWTNGHRTG